MFRELLTYTVLTATTFAAEMPLDQAAQIIRVDSSQKMTSCVLIFDADGYILGTARKDNPKAFGMPGGKLELNDNFYQAAIRETFEETGVNLEQDKLTPIFRAPDGPFDVITFCVGNGILETRPELDPGQGEGVCRWITPKEFASGSFPAYNLSLLKTLPDYLRKFYQNEPWYQAIINIDLAKLPNNEVRKLVLES